jgi:hypothetical protein
MQAVTTTVQVHGIETGRLSADREERIRHCLQLTRAPLSIVVPMNG